MNPELDWRSRVRALPWLLCFQFFIAEQIARPHVNGPYSMARNSISDLGALHPFGTGSGAATSSSRLHALMNTSFTLQGMLIFFGAVLVRRFFPAGGLARVAFLSFAISGVGLFIVGLAPEDTGGRLHVAAASAHFLCGSLAMLLLGLAILRSSHAAGILSVSCGLLALAATLLLGFRNTAAWHTLGWQVGMVERIAAYPLPLWLMLTGFVLLLGHAPRSDP